MTIEISKRSTGGYTIEASGNIYHVSDADYCTADGSILLIIPSTHYFSPGYIPVEDIVIEGCGNFTTTQQVASALDSIGIGYKGIGTPAKFPTGKISFSAQPAAADTVTIDDGTNTAVVFEFGGVKAEGAIALADAGTPGNPEDGNTITFDDGGNNETVFEFDDDEEITEGSILVEIGADEDATMVNFIAAFNAAIEGWTAYPSGTPDHQCSIVADEVGEDYNVTISKTGDNITATSPTGGADPDITEGNVEVVIGTDLQTTITNLETAFTETRDEGDLLITAKAYSTYVNLIHLEIGTGGNETITKSGSTITVTGMAGGADEVTLQTLIDAVNA
jgi:hypothetical protein